MNVKSIFCLVVFFIFSPFSIAQIVSKDVQYSVGDTQFKGYIAYDDAIKGKRPGVLVVHEWWGHNDYARKRANMLAELGYTAIALDMYGDGKQANHPKDASKFAGAVAGNLSEAENRFKAAYHLLQQQPQTDSDKISAIGYCFGGGIVLAMARRGVDLKGVVSFHGSLGLGAPAQKGTIKSRILVLNGEADPFIKAEQIESFKQEMTSLGVNFQFVNYPNAKHAFTNPGADKFGKQFSIPLQYNETADIQSWKKMQQFLKKTFSN